MTTAAPDPANEPTPPHAAGPSEERYHAALADVAAMTQEQLRAAADSGQLADQFGEDWELVYQDAVENLRDRRRAASAGQA